MKGKFFWGVFFILAAVFMLFSATGAFAEVNVFGIICTVFLIAIIIQSSLHLNFTGILFPLAILAIIYAEPLGISQLTPWPVLGVALFGSIGLSILFGNYKKKYGCGVYTEHFDEVIDIPDDKVINLRTTFGSSIKYVNTDNFQKANIDCSFGAMKIYFDKAKIQNERAELNMNVSFGGMELYIPRDWKVMNNTDVTLGGIDEKNTPENSEKPMLILTGKVSFAGVEIIYI